MSRLIKIIALIFILSVVTGCACAAGTLELPANLTVIKAEAFMGDSSIDTVIVPEGTAEIGSRAFANSSVKRIQLPNSLKTIAADAFEGVTSFTAAAAEGSYAYDWCAANNIPVESWLEETPASHFKYSERTVNGVQGWRIDGCNTQIADVIVPAEIEGKPVFYIYPEYYKANEALRSIYLPDGLVFNETGTSTNLTSVSFASTTDVLFAGVTSLENAVIRKSNKTSNGSISIDADAFANCTNLKTVVLSDDIEMIGNYAFQNCTSLSEITLPKSLKAVFDGAFDGCTSLRKINGVYTYNSVDTNAFRNCKSLESLILLGDVTYISKSGFEGCENLTLTVMPGSDIIAKCDNLGLKYVIADYGYETNYQVEGSLIFTGYAGEEAEITVPAEAYGFPVSSIAYEAFKKNETITAVTVEEGVSEINMYAFRECPNLKTVILPDSVTTMKSSVFSIGKQCFQGCTVLKKIHLPASLTEIPYFCFWDCYDLEFVNIPEGVTAIGMSAFGYCNSLDTITLPESLVNLADNAFMSATNHVRSFAVLSRSADISYSTRSLWMNKDCPVYCYQYTGAEAWAKECGFSVAYLDDAGFDSVGSISLPESMRLAVGESDWIGASIFPDFGNLDRMWISKNGNVATVSNGRVTAKAKGTAEITLMVGNKSASMLLNVYLPLTSFDLSENEITLEVGKTHALGCENFLPEDGGAVFAYASSNALAAAVDASGMITANAIGDAVITVTSDSGIARTCLVHIVRPAI